MVVMDWNLLFSELMASVIITVIVVLSLSVSLWLLF